MVVRREAEEPVLKLLHLSRAQEVLPGTAVTVEPQLSNMEFEGMCACVYVCMCVCVLRVCKKSNFVGIKPNGPGYYLNSYSRRLSRSLSCMRDKIMHAC